MWRPRITEDRIEAYRHMYYDLGWTMQRIADHFSLKLSSVQEAMQKRGLAPGGAHNGGEVRNYRGTPITGCWLWTGWVDKDGYGSTTWETQKVRTHRAAYEAFYGPIPPGMNVCHSCDNPACYRPDHLFLGTQKDNIRDMIVKGRWAGNTRLTPDQKQLILDFDVTKKDGTFARLCTEFGITVNHGSTLRQENGKSQPRNKLTSEQKKAILDCDTSHFDGRLTRLCEAFGITIGHASNIRRQNK